MVMRKMVCVENARDAKDGMVRAFPSRAKGKAGCWSDIIASLSS